MKTGLLTFYHIHHYGAMLQAYATERAVASLGSECEIIDYYVNQDNSLFRRPTGLGSAAHDAHTALHYTPLKTRYERFERFARERLRISGHRYESLEELRAAKLPTHVRPVWFSLADESADVCALSIRQEKDGMSFVLEDQEEGTFVVKIPAMGKHNVANALAAYCAATRLGCDPRKVIQGLAAFEQTGRRQKVVDSKGVTVIEDCYNANPDSMKAALAMFKEFPCKRRFALLGDMLELGDLSREAHEELGRLAAESDLYCLVTYGEQAKRTAVVAAAKGQKTLHANNYREAADALLNRIQPGDALLVKASRGMALEKALEIFYAEQKDARE